MNKYAKQLALLALSAISLPSLAISRCTTFDWVTDFDGAEKSAMIVEAQIDDQPYTLQFDTGSDVTGLFADSGFSFTNDQSEASADQLKLKPTQIRRLPGRSGKVQGRLGLASLLGKILKIDYPNNLICQVTESEFKERFYQLQLATAKIRSNKLFIFTELDGDYWPGLFFDTGASLYPLLVDKNHWQQLTGRTGDEKENRYIEGWSKQQLITTVGAPLESGFSIGSFQVSSAEVHFTLQRPDYFSNYPIDAQGLIGNAPFFDEVIYLDLRKEDAWFGVLKRERR